MTSTLALLGFLALTFLLVCRALMACQRRNSHVHRQQHRKCELANRKTERKPTAIPPEKSDTLVPVRQA